MKQKYCAEQSQSAPANSKLKRLTRDWPCEYRPQRHHGPDPRPLLRSDVRDVAVIREALIALDVGEGGGGPGEGGAATERAEGGWKHQVEYMQSLHQGQVFFVKAQKRSVSARAFPLLNSTNKAFAKTRDPGR